MMLRPTCLAALFLCLALSPAIAVADLPMQLNDGWHSWTIDSERSATIYVRLELGELRELRSEQFNCLSGIPAGVTSHGIVSADENFHWFRRFVEDKSVSRRIRNSALFGIAQSDSDLAFRYLDTLITG